MLPDLDSLALFVRAAETRNLTRAAEASAITAPAASRRLSLLEHQLKVQLFERHPRGLQLTPAGQQLLRLAREVIASVHHMRSEMSNYALGRRSVLRVYANTSALSQFLPADIAAFQGTHPEVRIVLEECWSADGVRRVLGGEVDLGVIVGGIDPEGLHCVPYRCDRLAAVVPGDSPFAGDSVAFGELLDHDLVGLESGSSLTRLLEAQAEQLMKPMALRVQVRSFEAVCRAVEARLGCGVLPLHAARGVAQALGLRVLPLSDAWASRRMMLCVRGAPADDSALGALLAHLGALADAPLPPAG